ncbi:hypothetical protein H9X57_12605 [Flavobacterium piscinae]|uniref:hypothetical protein n=1 Tax=Flavobacterium piscinae TaxID=2506424 RepID=UPI00198C190D|nr:hypothetical protein [Flavobacterium piscinae]MBC8883887.1 hypothetical protein [Flavobacterium piscinae]
MIGALIASLALVLMPFSTTIFMAASLLWILDAANNIAMEPYRAFVADRLPKEQHSIGFLMQSFFTGLGITLANFTPAILVSLGILAITDKFENGIPTYTYWAFFIGAFASVVTILISVFTTKEIPPSSEELEELLEKKNSGCSTHFYGNKRSIYQHAVDDETINSGQIFYLVRHVLLLAIHYFYLIYFIIQYNRSSQ